MGVLQRLRLISLRCASRPNFCLLYVKAIRTKSFTRHTVAADDFDLGMSQRPNRRFLQDFFPQFHGTSFLTSNGIPTVFQRCSNGVLAAMPAWALGHARSYRQYMSIPPRIALCRVAGNRAKRNERDRRGALSMGLNPARPENTWRTQVRLQHGVALTRCQQHGAAQR